MLLSQSDFWAITWKREEAVVNQILLQPRLEKSSGEPLRLAKYIVTFSVVALGH